MGKAWLVVLAAVFVVSGVDGCSGKVTVPVPPKVSGPKPETVIANIDAAFTRRDVVEYDSTLASDYVFRFQPGEIQQGVDSLSRAEEMSFADHLFLHGSASGEPAASRIDLRLTIQDSSSDLRSGHSGWKKYVVNTHVVLYGADAMAVWEISSPAWFYFKQQPAGSGRWRLVEWADQPGTASAPHGRPPASAQGSLADASTTWGQLKRMYLAAPAAPHPPRNPTGKLTHSVPR